MKKQLLFIASLFTAFSLSAQQIENPGFESWETDENEIEIPSGHWFSISECLSPTFCIIFPNKAEGHTGFGAKIQAQGIPASAAPLAYSGPFTSKPTKLTFWYQSTKPVTAFAILSKGEPFTEDAAEEAIGFGGSELEPASAFTKIEIPITYKNEDATDSIGIGFTFGEQELSTEDYFIIDDVELSYEVTGLSNQQMAQIIGSNVVTSSLNLKESVEELNVYNTSGLQVLNAANIQIVDFSRLPEGLYMVTLKKGIQ
ncbi:MAG: hypothetical protein NVV82_02455 [Sporocytophaga sp.]|nr:hypothetical protein [Sporocytophaga sp.]